MPENDGDGRGTTPAALESAFRDFIKDELRGVYTATIVIVEDVDEGNRRATVSKKSDRDVLVSNVPIASPFATDGAGMITPISRRDEGLLIHTKEPLEKQLVRHGEQQPEGERRFTLEGGILLPMLWLDVDDVPEHEKGEFQIALPGDGSALRMFPDGRARLEHSSGNVIAMDADGNVTIGSDEDAESLLQEGVTIEYEDTQPDGSVETKEADVDVDGDGSTDDFQAS